MTAPLNAPPSTDCVQPPSRSRSDLPDPDRLESGLPDPPLSAMIAAYQATIASLQTGLTAADNETEKSALVRQVWEVLTTRDRLQTRLEQPWANFTETTKPDCALQQADAQLKALAEAINQTVTLADLRAISQPAETAWWWFLDRPQPMSWWARHDWLCNTLSVAFLIATGNFAADISTRILLGSPDLIGFLLITKSLAPAIVAGGALTQGTRDSLERCLTDRKIPRHWWAEIVCGISLLLFLPTWHLWFSLPKIADHYQAAGDSGLEHGKIAHAESNYKRAIALDPGRVYPYSQLGKLFEELKDPKQAIANYLIAYKGNVPQTAEKIARVYLVQQRDLVNADAWLWKALESQRQRKEQQQPYAINAEQYSVLRLLALEYLRKQDGANATRWLKLGIGGTKSESEPQISLKTYLGWVQLNQGEYRKAQGYLAQAVTALEREVARHKPIAIETVKQLQVNHADAYCLWAQALEKDQKDATAQWNYCVQNGDQTDLDVDRWIRMRLQYQKRHLSANLPEAPHETP